MGRDEDLRQITELAVRLSDEDLRAVLEFLSQDYKARLKRASQQAALAFKPGDDVESIQPSRKLPAGARGHVNEVRGGTVLVHFPEYGAWRMDATLVRKITEPPKPSS